MVAKRKPIVKPIEPQVEIQPEQQEEIIEEIEVIKPHNLVIPDKMYERMHNIGNDAYWLRMIELHIETMMTRFHQ
ncbi:MAG: hypothetical protein UW18_C0011G0020 [Microgenomates group bacterium GW2011_GWF1_44_10]|nr:MAG: hypothetical protein UW18_C0011G0020 [Microgenomates group bacterium GW2011_GWF1_44_10]